MFFLAAKVIRDTKNEEYSKDFYLWEKDSARASCRKCNNAFSTFTRRHHCRLCGGVFCEGCTLTNVVVDDETLDRICQGCARHETPGKTVRAAMETKIQKVLSDSAEANKSGKSDGGDGISHVVCPQLDYGSVFEPNSLSSKGSNLAAAPPPSGYFEIINKSNYFIGVKVLAHPTSVVPSVTQILYDIARPNYLSVPPNELVHADISSAMSGEGVVDVFILYHNPNLMPGDINSVRYDTRKPLKISPCASIENFMEVSVWRIRCKSKNVLLKYKGENVLEPRIGNSVDRKGGLLNMITGSGKSEGGKDLDFATNINVSAITKIA
jgi:hypothetical protein